MKISVIGPNLPDQRKGTFHAHADGCSDLEKRQYRGVERDTGVEVATRLEVAEFVYPRNSFEWDDESWYIDDIWFAPCLKGLPR